MILIYKPKPEHIQQIVFSGFGKYEQINKLPATLKNSFVDTFAAR
jgi:hypothetical protein